MSVGCVGCSEQVSLGAWNSSGVTGGGAATGGGGSSGAGNGGGGAKSCPREAGTPGPRNAAGSKLEVTVTYTDWTWPAPSDSLEWDFTLENGVSRDGYFWAHGFDLVGSTGGFIGLQYRGGYQADPPDGVVQVENMLVFWMSSHPLRAELGDVAYPNARKYLKIDANGEWWTIHALYDWQVCRTYRLRVARHSTEANGDIWYGAWVLDTVTNVELFFGRILVPAAWGQISTTTQMWSNRIGFTELRSCSELEPVSAIFGYPTANSGTVHPGPPQNRFESPPSCGSSRFTDFPDEVRQELGVP